jgi:hypothetical protein
MDLLPIINKNYELFKFVFCLNNKLEKRYRYALGQNLEASVLDLMSNLIMAKNAPKQLKAAYLIKANSCLEISVLKLRLYLELGLASHTKIFQAQSILSQIGRMLGGWLKSLS